MTKKIILLLFLAILSGTFHAMNTGSSESDDDTYSSESSDDNKDIYEGPFKFDRNGLHKP